MSNCCNLLLAILCSLSLEKNKTFVTLHIHCVSQMPSHGAPRSPLMKTSLGWLPWTLEGALQTGRRNQSQWCLVQAQAGQTSPNLVKMLQPSKLASHLFQINKKGRREGEGGRGRREREGGRRRRGERKGERRGRRKGEYSISYKSLHTS